MNGSVATGVRRALCHIIEVGDRADMDMRHLHPCKLTNIFEAKQTLANLFLAPILMGDLVGNLPPRVSLRRRPLYRP